MTDISTGNLDPDDRDADRDDLPVTQVDEDEVTSHEAGGDAPEGEGVGVAGGTTPHSDEPAEGVDEERGV